MSAHRFPTTSFVFAIAFGAVLPAGSADGEVRDLKADAEVTPAEKLERIIVPRVELSKAPLADALEFLRIRSADLDTTVAKGSPGRGLNFILKDPGGKLAEAEMTLTLNRVPLRTLLDYIARFSGATYRVDSHAVVIGKPGDLGGDGGMILPGRLRGGERVVFERLRDTMLPAVSIQDATLEEVIEYFRAVSVPQGAGASDKRLKSLNFVLKNPDKELPKITLHMKHVPLGTALRYACELSGVVYTMHPNAVAIGRADDLLPRPADPGAHAYGRSGVRPGGAALAARLKRLVVPVVELKGASVEDALELIRATALNADQAAGVADPKGINIVNLAQDNTQRISLSLSDIPAWELMTYITGLTETEFRVERLAVLVDWKLPRRKVAEEKAGEEAVPAEAPKVLEVPRIGEPVRVLQVPILDPDSPFSVPPEGRGGWRAPVGNGLGRLNFPLIPIAPATPTAFEVRNVGVTMETEPVVSGDGRTIDLNISAEVVEFDGFLNYGSPIRLR